MIQPVGAVMNVVMQGGPRLRVQVISDGPPDQPSTAWAVTCDEPIQYVLVKRVSVDPPAYMGMKASQYKTVSAGG